MKTEDKKGLASDDGGDEDIYSEKLREELIEEEDEITAEDEGFMQGYEEEEKTAECSHCKQILDSEDFVEEEIGGKVYRFCSHACAEEFEQQRKAKSEEK